MGALRGCKLLLNHVKSCVLVFFLLFVCILPKSDFLKKKFSFFVTQCSPVQLHPDQKAFVPHTSSTWRRHVFEKPSISRVVTREGVR